MSRSINTSEHFGSVVGLVTHLEEVTVISPTSFKVLPQSNKVITPEVRH